MTPIVRHGKYMSQINTTPIYENTTITLVDHGHSVIVNENDQIIAWISAPIMKVVRAIRTMYPKAKLELV